MKKLIFLLLGIVILSSCNISYDESQVNNPKKSTTIEIQENVLDSCATIAEMNGSIYILDENQLVTHELKGIDGNHIVIYAYNISFNCGTNY